MVDTTSFSKLRQRRFKGVSGKEPVGRNKSLLRNSLYTKEEFELLDTIYSEDGTSQVKQETLDIEEFWPKERDEYLSLPLKKTPLLTNIIWFLGGVLASSVIWLIYTQVSFHEIKTKADTEIVFQKSAAVMTDKNFDKEAQKQLNKNNTKPAGFFANLFHTNKSSNTKEISKLNSEPNQQVSESEKEQILPEVKQETPQPQAPTIRYYTVQNGDSLWIIANKLYSNPSPQNINKIMKANNMKRVGVLSLGQKLIIPE